MKVEVRFYDSAGVCINYNEFRRDADNPNLSYGTRIPEGAVHFSIDAVMTDEQEAGELWSRAR
jgi:hypothetical protein